MYMYICNICDEMCCFTWFTYIILHYSWSIPNTHVYSRLICVYMYTCNMCGEMSRFTRFSYSMSQHAVI